jgi:hypothetical protein
MFASYTSDRGLITRIYKLCKKSWPNEEMGKWTEQSLFKGRSPKWVKKKLKEMLTILGHKGNANQNHIKILPYSF